MRRGVTATAGEHGSILRFLLEPLHDFGDLRADLVRLLAHFPPSPLALLPELP